MKKMTLLAAFAAALCLVACNKDQPTPGPETKDAISVSPVSVTFEGEGGNLRAAVTTNVADYSISGAADWLTVAKNGKELSLTAAANTVNEARNCTLTLKAGTASCTLAVAQKAGSPFPGYTALASAEFAYSGTLLYQFLKPTEEDYGGQGMINLIDEEGNQLVLWVYTELFTSADEVVLNEGTYVKGEDAFPVLCGKKMTFAPGVLMEDEEDGDTVMGSYYMSVLEELTALSDGTIQVTYEGAVCTIKVDMTDAAGKAYKYVYQGEVDIDTEGATYPKEGEDDIDVANTVYRAFCYYYGDSWDNGTSMFQLVLYSGTPEYNASTVFEFFTEPVEFSEGMDISGEFYISEDETTLHQAGTLSPGYLEHTSFGDIGFGCYVWYPSGRYMVADAFSSLQLAKQDDGKYTLTGVLMSEEGDMIMFMGSDFTGIHDLEIPVINAID